MRIARTLSAIVILVLVLAMPTLAIAQREPSQGELRAAKALDDVRGDPLALNDFLSACRRGASFIFICTAPCLPRR